MAYYEGEVSGLGNSNCNNGGMFGDWWGGIIGLIAVAAIFGGGNGLFGNNNNALSRADLCEEMGFNDVQSGIRGISQGICDSTFALNNTITNGFAGVQQTLCQGFGGINTALVQQGYETRLGVNSLSSQLASCCCDLRSGQADIKYQLASDTCDIKQAIGAQTQQILGYLTSEKISALQAENSLLTAQLSQNSQTNTIINALRPVAQPAYITCSPFESAYGFYGNRSGYGNSGCGCGCGCNG